MSPDANFNPDLAGRTPDAVGVVRRQWPVILLCTALAALIAYAYVSSSEVTYESKSSILLVALPGEIPPGGGRERTLDVETQATVARSTALLEAVGQRLDLSASEVKDKSRVEAAPTGDVLFLYFTDDDAEFAAEGATVYSEEFLAQRKAAADDVGKREQALIDLQIEALQDDVETLTQQIEDEQDKGQSASTAVLNLLNQRLNLAIRDLSAAEAGKASIDTDQNPGRVLVDPRTAVNKTGLSLPLAVGGATVVGLLVGVIIGLLRDRRDDRYGSAIGLESAGVQEIGRLRYPGASQRPDSAQRDYARLLVRLGFTNGPADSGSRSILVVAVENTTLPPQTMRSVAQLLAAQGPDNGLLTTIISTERNPSDAATTQASYWNQFGAHLTEEMRHHDIVLVVAGSFDRSVAGLAVASKVDQTILLVSESTRVGELVSVIEDLESVDAREVGVVVLTKVPPRRRW